MASSIDPIDRFEELLRVVTPAAPAIKPDKLQAVIEQHQGEGDAAVSTALSHHIALNTSLTEQQATDLVTETIPETGDAASKAQAVSSATTPVVTGEVQLSDPVMLWPWLRGVFAFVLAAELFLTVGLVYSLDSAAPNAAYIALAVLAGLSLIGLLVLVMGYKAVTIKGGTGSSGS